MSQFEIRARKKLSLQDLHKDGRKEERRTEGREDGKKAGGRKEGRKEGGRKEGSKEERRKVGRKDWRKDTQGIGSLIPGYSNQSTASYKRHIPWNHVCYVAVKANKTHMIPGDVPFVRGGVLVGVPGN